MQTTQINQEIRSFLLESFLSGHAERLRDDGTLLGEVIDSTGVLELVNFLQERFAITVDDDDVNPENLASVNSLVVFVSNKVANGSQKA